MSGDWDAGQDWCARLYDEKAAGLLLYGRALGLSHSESEDVLQDTFSALLGLKDQPEQPGHYCVRAFRNRALNFKRTLWRRVRREVEARGWFEKQDGETRSERAATKCLVQLPPEQREVIVLKIWSEYTFEEIARLLDLSPNTVAGRYRYGLEKIRKCLKEENYEQPELDREPFAGLEAAQPVA
jgi:RNA polymerase sigma-70 factor, ECF subfamily